MHLSDARNKATALARIKRLSSSGLPLEPFIRSLFELINDGIPHHPNKVFFAGRPNQVEAFLGNTLEARAAVPIHTPYFVESGPEISGARFRIDSHAMLHILPTKTVWRHHEVWLPEFHRGEGYNAVQRPLGFTHMLAGAYHDAGEFLGFYPIWRGFDQKAFSREDCDFVMASAPHISHGLKVARLMSRMRSQEGTSFAPTREWPTGAILLDSKGRPIAIDNGARLIFRELDAFDGGQIEHFDSARVRDVLRNLAVTLGRIFYNPDGGASTATAPVYRLFHHWSGIILSLRGIRMAGDDGREYVTVLVERGESAENRHRRMMARWGLSHREAEVLGFIAQGKTGPEISILLGIRHDTVRRHTGNIFQKLGVETRTAAATLALEALSLSTNY
jgi:DNA-binding CsgD family transcriptional regulator